MTKAANPRTPKAHETTYDLSVDEGSVKMEVASLPVPNRPSSRITRLLRLLAPAKDSRSMIGLISSVACSDAQSNSNHIVKLRWAQKIEPNNFFSPMGAYGHFWDLIPFC